MIVNCRWCGKPMDMTVPGSSYYADRNYCSEKCYREFQRNKASNGTCFITTAVCKTLNKPDDCAELTALRNFRDIFMMESDEMHEEVHEYYHIAPQICAEIEKTPNFGSKAYSEIWEKYLKSAVEAVDKGEKQKAHDIYKRMVLDLNKEYLG
jgi:hypothetical protein